MSANTIYPIAEPVEVATNAAANSIQPCSLSLLEGCYRISLTTVSKVYHGTMRVQELPGAAKTYVISGDLYTVTNAAAAPGIPIYPRNNYDSYLKVNQIIMPAAVPAGDSCTITLTLERYKYAKATGSFAVPFHGFFKDNLIENVSVVISNVVGNVYSGTWRGAESGNFTMEWVSARYRKAEVQIDTVVGGLTLQNPLARGSVMDSFQKSYEEVGWEFTLVRNTSLVPLPDAVQKQGTWTNSSLHKCMIDCTASLPSLDTTWRVHLLIVPSTLVSDNQLLGQMYDTINEEGHRQGAAVFSNAVAFAPNGEFNNPLSHLLVAIHETGHGFNMAHPSNSKPPVHDNSIMTSIDMVKTEIVKSGGNFPEDANIAFNDFYKQQLRHRPDPFVRPGAIRYISNWDDILPTKAAAILLSDATAVLEVSTQGAIIGISPDPALRAFPVVNPNGEAPIARLKLGEPLPIRWALTKKSDAPIDFPEDISIEGHHASIRVLTPSGDIQEMPTYIIRSDYFETSFQEKGKTVNGDTNLFWSSDGFAFSQPGRYEVEIRVQWESSEKTYEVMGKQEVWVDYPISELENEVAALLLNKEVGVFVALADGASHLTQAVKRIEKAITIAPNHPASLFFKTLPGHQYSPPQTVEQPEKKETDGKEPVDSKVDPKKEDKPKESTEPKVDSKIEDLLKPKLPTDGIVKESIP